jgi:hypothetical protein
MVWAAAQPPEKMMKRMREEMMHVFRPKTSLDFAQGMMKPVYVIK